MTHTKDIPTIAEIGAVVNAVLADHESEVFKLRAQVSELLLELDRSKRQTEMLASLQPDLVEAQNRLAEARNGREVAQRDAAVLGAQLAAKTEQANDLAERLKTCESRAKEPNAK